jgi:hypothetical protein
MMLAVVISFKLCMLWSNLSLDVFTIVSHSSLAFFGYDDVGRGDFI